MGTFEKRTSGSQMFASNGIVLQLAVDLTSAFGFNIRYRQTSTSTNEHVLRLIAKLLVVSCLWAIMSYSCNNHTFDTFPNKNTVNIS